MMADIIVQTLKIDDDASAGLTTAAQGADKLAAAEAHATAEAARLQQALVNSVQFTPAQQEAIAKTMAMEQALRAQAAAAGVSVAQMRAINAELERSALVNMKAAQAAQAAVATQAKKSALPVFGPANFDEFGDSLQATAAGLDTVSKAADTIDPAMKRAAFGAKNLRFQLADITTTLVGGMNPFVVLAQQGPDLVHAFDAGGGAAATMKATFGGLASQASALAPILATVGVAVAALGTAALVAFNDFEAGEDTLTGVNRAILETGDYSAQSAEDLKTYTAAMVKLRQAGDDARRSLIALQAGMSSALMGGATSVEAARAGASPALVAAGTRVARLERELQAAQAAAYSGDLTGEESIARQRKLTAELEKAEAALNKLKAERDDAVVAINATANAEEQLRLAEEAEREAAKANAQAKRDMTAANREAAEWTRHAKEINEAYYAALQRNLDAIRAGEELFYAQASASARLNDSLRPLIERVDAIAPPEALDRVTQLTLLLMELETRAAGSAEANAALADEIERVGSALAMEQAQSRITAAQTFAPADLSGIVGSIGSGLDAVSGSGGDVFAMLGGGASAAGSLLGAAGVAGAAAAVAPVAAVAAALGALVKLTDAIVVTSKERGEGETSIFEKSEDFLNDFFAQFAELPAAIVEGMANVDLGALSENFALAIEGFMVGLIENAPELIDALIRSFLIKSTFISNAIIGAIPEVVAAMVEVFGNPQTWIDMARAIVQAFKDVIGENLDIRRETRNALSAQVGSGVQGLGERLRGTGASIAISGVVGDTREVVRTIRDRLGALGSGLSFSRDSRWNS